MNKNSVNIQSKMDNSSELSCLSAVNITLERKFVWNNNSDIVQLLLGAQNQPQLFSNVVKIRPLNGSQILYTKSLCNRVRNNDGYIWQKKNQRKTTRENQMLFKVNGVECLLAKYTRSAVLPSFQRRCYFLRQNPDVVFFHYLNVPSLTVDYKLCIPTATLSETDLQGINEITLFEQLTGMFDNFPTQISKMDGFGFVNLDIQSITRAIVQSIILQKQKRYCIDPPLSNSCYVFSTATDHRTVPKISHSLSSISKSSVGSGNKNINSFKESYRSNKSPKSKNEFPGPNNWSKARQSDSCIDTAMGNRNMNNLPEEDFFLSRTNSNKMISLIDYRLFNQDLIISSSSNQSMKSNNPNSGDTALDSQASISFNNINDQFNNDPATIIPESDTMMKIDHNLNDILVDSQSYIGSFDLNDCAYWADFEGSIDVDASGPSCSEPIDDSFDISGDFNFDYMSTFPVDCLPQSDNADLSDDNLNLNIVISHYAPSWSPLQGGGSILIAGSGICENLFQQQYCNVVFGSVSMPALVIQNGLLKAEIPAQSYPGEVGVKIQVGSQMTGSLIMFKYVCTTLEDQNVQPSTSDSYNISRIINSWIYQKESQLKVIVVDQMALLEEEIMKVKVVPNSTLDLKSYDIIENISVDMIRVRHWCCRDSLELVLARCCFTWCRRALSTLMRQVKSNLSPTESSHNQIQTSAKSNDDLTDSFLIDLSLVHAAAGLGYVEFLRLFLIWRLLHLRQLRIYNSNNLNTDESKLTLQWSLEKMEIISGLNDDSIDKNGFSPLMWAGLRDHGHALRLLAMWSPRMILIRHRESGLSLIDILKQQNKAYMISHIVDIIDRYNDTNGTFSSPPAGQIDALWECMASTSESDFDDLAEIDDILKLGLDCPTDEISSSVNSHHEIDHPSLDSSKCQSMENLDGVNQNEVQMVCLAGRIIQAMPIRIKQKPSYMDCNELPSRGVSNDEPLIFSENHRHSSHFRPVLDRNRSFSHSSFSSAGAEGVHNNNIGSSRLSNGRHTTDDSGISTPFDDSRYLRQSPSPSREFNLDSPPPTTAEIADHFNAPACFMEADFSRLTLSDHEQKRLYEAAKLIQKCYRRYRQGKTRERTRGPAKSSSNCTGDESPCKKVFLSASKSKLQYIVNKVVPTGHGEQSRMGPNLSNIDDNYQKFPNRIVTKRRFSSQDEQEVEADCQKEIEAAIIIQSYYRRYKQYAYYKRMCQAAVLIQNQFRWYVEHKKSASDNSQNRISNNNINKMSVSQNYRNYCKKRSNTLPNTLGRGHLPFRNLFISSMNDENSKYRTTNIGPCLLPPKTNVKFQSQ